MNNLGVETSSPKQVATDDATATPDAGKAADDTGESTRLGSPTGTAPGCLCLFG